MTIKDKLLERAKAAAALIVPIVVAALSEALLDISQEATGTLALIAGTLAVYLTPNKPKTV